MYSNVDERINRSFQILNQFGVAFPFPDDASQFSVHSNNSYQKLSQNDSAPDEIKKNSAYYAAARKPTPRSARLVVRSSWPSVTGNAIFFRGLPESNMASSSTTKVKFNKTSCYFCNEWFENDEIEVSFFKSL